MECLEVGHLDLVVILHSYKVLVEGPGGKRLLERPRRRWEDNITMSLKETRCEGVDWIDLAKDRDR
jgi:hypothetical protein